MTAIQYDIPGKRASPFLVCSVRYAGLGTKAVGPLKIS